MKLNQVYEMDALEMFSHLNDKSVDAVIGDPPYNVTNLGFDKLFIDWQAFWSECRRVLVSSKSPVILSSQQPFTTDLIMSNRKGFRYEIIWHKTMGTGFLDANRRPLRCHENIIVFADGLPEYTPQMEASNKPIRNHKRKGASEHYGKQKRDEGKIGGDLYPRSVWTFHQDSVGGDTRKDVSLHPTQKPLALMERLILTYTDAAALVVDPFAGSGTTLLAAQRLGRRFVGCDIDPDYVEVARKRLAMPYSVPMFAD